MAEKTEEKLVEVIEFLAEKVIKKTLNLSADEALKFTQAVLNTAHTIQVLYHST